MAPSEHPAATRRAWGLDQPRRSGPRASITTSQIIDAGIALADAGGLEACSMPKLASSLGVGTMSLYRHIDDKAELTALMRDYAIGPVPPDAPRMGPWDEAMRFYADTMSERYFAHPWLLDVPITGFPQTPRVLDWVEFGLAALTAAGLSPRTALRSTLLLDGQVTAAARLRRDSGPDDETRSLSDLLDVEDYPALRSTIATGVLADKTFDDGGLQFGVGVIIEGIRALLEEDPPSA
ncbi:TetR/AcrR family transcriptional regulator [Saxibacter everestensis]|uniref:TetR/AcrR family transcriptional regulator n=1 Tax=Saxibacter everestensis TaxID=2909229 RepID=A0ABY8QU56_9MICO|nr:TetR/AcrR family transcriptional regulator [Brevibacteriaceae bacterium ZFBP1038]